MAQIRALDPWLCVPGFHRVCQSYLIVLNFLIHLHSSIHFLICQYLFKKVSVKYKFVIFFIFTIYPVNYFTFASRQIFHCVPHNFTNPQDLFHYAKRTSNWMPFSHIPAATCFPGQLPAKYHRHCGA